MAIQSKTRHPNVIQLMAVSLGKSSVYIVSELVPGVNLDDILFGEELTTQNYFQIPEDKKPYVGKQVSQAVAYLHNLKPPIVHRDIKPENVLVAKDSLKTKLCDMGLSKIKSFQSLSRTGSQAIPGTPSYMTQKCLIYKRSATTMSDIWSLGCTLLELFTGQETWQELSAEQNTGDNELDTLGNVLRKEMKPMSLG